MTRSGRRLHPETRSSFHFIPASHVDSQQLQDLYPRQEARRRDQRRGQPCLCATAQGFPTFALTLPLVCIRIQTFRLEERQIPELEDGQVLAKTLYLSNDPAQRSKQALQSGSRRNRSLGDTHTDCCTPFTSLD